MSIMEKAYNVAALAVRRRLAEQHPDDLAVLNSIGPDEVVAYTGAYDQVQNVLKCLNVPFRMDPKPKKLKAHLVFVNCSNSADSNLLTVLKDYVHQGGWLVTSDWALRYVLQDLFPEIVRWNNKTTPDEVIAVEPELNGLWSEVVVLGADPQWWLEASSYPIEIVNREQVRVEAASHELLRKYDAPAVGVTFNWGHGHVYHVISHFWLKRSRTPQTRYQGPATDFLKAGMRLSEVSVNTIFKKAGVKPDTLNFATIQSAVTSTELVAQLCIRAKKI